MSVGVVTVVFRPKPEGDKSFVFANGNGPEIVKVFDPLIP